MLQGMRDSMPALAKQKGEQAATQTCSTRARTLSRVYRKLETCGKPFAAAINGICARRRVRARARLPLPRRRRRHEDRARPARGQGRAVPRRRRHAARAAPDADARRRADDAVQGRADQGRRRAKAMNLVHARRAARRARRRPRRPGSRAAARPSQPWDEKGFKLPGGTVYSPAGMQILPAANAIYRKRDLRQLPGRRARS